MSWNKQFIKPGKKQGLRLGQVWPWGLLSLLIISLVSCNSPEPSAKLPAQVHRVVDGDTIEVILTPNAQTNSAQPHNTPIEQVRLIGIDAPEFGQVPWANSARAFVEQALAEGTLYLEFDQQRSDPFGRLLAYGWHDRQLLNAEIVMAGHALVSPYFPNVKYEKRLQRAQETARLRGVGIWDPEQPLGQTPQEFRRQSR